MENFNQLVNRAYENYQQKSFSLALSLIMEAENVLPQNSSAEEGASIENFKGYCYLSLDKVNDAKESFEKALELNPLSSQACAGLAEVFFLLNNDQEAKKMFEYAINYNPNNPLARAGLAKVNKSLGLPESSVNNQEIAPKAADQTFQSTIEEAYHFFNNKRFEEALIKLAEAEKKSPEVSSEVENFKGMIYLALNDKEKARETFEKSLKLNPKSSQACAGLGEILYLENKDEEAKKMFEWAVMHNENNPFAVAGLSKVNKSLGKPIYDNSLNENILQNVSFEILFADAYQAFKDKDFNTALDRITEFERITKTAIENFRGYNYLAKNEIIQAKASFEKALETNETSSQACAGLAEVMYLEKNDDAAKTMFEYAVKNNPDNKIAVEGLAKVNRNLGLPKDHNTLLIDEVLSDESLADLITKAYSEFDSKQYSSALNLLNDFEDKAVGLSLPTVVALSNFKGYIYLSLKELDNAKNCFENSLELEPESSQACAGLGEYFFLRGKDQESKKMFEWSLKHNISNEIALAGLHKINTNLGLPKDHNSLN